MLVTDFLENGAGDSRATSDNESALSDLTHLADNIMVPPLPWMSPSNRLSSSPVVAAASNQFRDWFNLLLHPKHAI